MNRKGRRCQGCGSLLFNSGAFNIGGGRRCKTCTVYLLDSNSKQLRYESRIFSADMFYSPADAINNSAGKSCEAVSLLCVR